tara:strand:+ start:443 stop:553 length:111 start_codon:yes stop_codon:yes gene_type:complete
MTVVILAVEVKAAAIKASSMISVAVDNTAEREAVIG